MAKFLRGLLVARMRELMMLDYMSNQRLHEFLQVNVDGGQRLSILDEQLRVNEYLPLQVEVAYVYVRRLALLGDAATVVSVGRPPVRRRPLRAARLVGTVPWEQPLWWGGIVRDLQWHCPVEWQVLTSALEPTREWWLLETPVGRSSTIQR